MSDKNEEEIVQGKPWKNVSYFDTYREADEKRTDLIKECEENQYQVKVKRLSERFVVKLRNIPTKNEDKDANRRSKHTAETKADKRRNRKSR
jgi:hypothetical protein